MSELDYFCVDANEWDDDLENTFGKSGSIHRLSCGQLINAIIKFGRASITYNNTYD